MEEIQFRKPQIEDKAVISSFFGKYPQRSCDRTFANIYLWSRQYPVTFAVVKGVLVFKSESEDHLAFAFPTGEDESVKEMIIWLEEYSRSRGRTLMLYNVTSESFQQLEAWFPGEFSIEYNRDLADYVYEVEKLMSLSGKKLHGKRNHINKFKEFYEGRWTYSPMTEENLEECFQMALKWRQNNGCQEDPEKNAEMCVTLNSLRLFSELGLKGGVLKIDGEVVAFTIGEEVSADTFVVHIEKAFSDIQGAYPMINQQFVENECGGYTYINREEDTGSEGLRKAKLSYRPVFFIEKGKVTRRG